MPTPRPGLPMTEERAGWDAFVASTEQATYLQMTPWAEVKAPNGWHAEHVEATDEGSRVGAQVLRRRPGGFRWSFGYAPRGPIAADWSEPADPISRWTEALRGHRWGDRVALVRIDPEIELDGPLDPTGRFRAALRSAGWRPSPSIQPSSTRVVDLTAGEEALWSDLRKKWRQYVNRARSNGITVVDADAGRLGDFHRIMTETSHRAGTPIRTEAAYRDIFEAFRPQGSSRLLFAQAEDGTPQATLLLLRSGGRVVEPYGGMTAPGAESRANYLLKWEAIRSSRESGATSYDMWGLVHPGIRQFKEGFGGREVHLIGGWELPLDAVGALAYRVGANVLEFGARLRGRRPSGNALAGDAG